MNFPKSVQSVAESYREMLAENSINPSEHSKKADELSSQVKAIPSHKKHTQETRQLYVATSAAHAKAESAWRDKHRTTKPGTDERHEVEQHMMRHQFAKEQHSDSAKKIPYKFPKR